MSYSISVRGLAAGGSIGMASEYRLVEFDKHLVRRNRKGFTVVAGQSLSITNGSSEFRGQRACWYAYARKGSDWPGCRASAKEI